MPRRRLEMPGPALEAAMREAHRHGQSLMPDEAAAFLARRARFHLFAPSVPDVVVINHRIDGSRFKRRGQVGPGTLQHPAWVATAERARDWLALAARLRVRRPPTRQAVLARQRRSGLLIARILALLDDYAPLGRSAAKAVAAELGLTAEYVRRVRACRPKQT